MSMIDTLNIRIASTGRIADRDGTTEDGYQYLKVKSPSSPILIFSYRIENTGAESLDYIILKSRDPEAAVGDFVEHATGTVLTEAIIESADAGENFHHGAFLVGVKSSTAGTPTDATIRVLGTV